MVEEDSRRNLHQIVLPTERSPPGARWPSRRQSPVLESVSRVRSREPVNDSGSGEPLSSASQRPVFAAIGASARRGFPSGIAVIHGSRIHRHCGTAGGSGAPEKHAWTRS